MWRQPSKVRVSPLAEQQWQQIHCWVRRNRDAEAGIGAFRTLSHDDARQPTPVLMRANQD